MEKKLLVSNSGKYYYKDGIVKMATSTNTASKDKGGNSVAKGGNSVAKGHNGKVTDNYITLQHLEKSTTSKYINEAYIKSSLADHLWT